MAWRRLCRSASLLPPTLPDPIPGAIDLLLRVPSLALSLILLRVRETKTGTRRTIHILSFLPHMFLLPLFPSVAFMLTSHSIHHFVSEERWGKQGGEGEASF